MEILQCHLFIIPHLKIYEYTCKHKFYLTYEMYNMNMINEISPLTSSSSSSSWLPSSSYYDHHHHNHHQHHYYHHQWLHTNTIREFNLLKYPFIEKVGKKIEGCYTVCLSVFLLYWRQIDRAKKCHPVKSAICLWQMCITGGVIYHQRKLITQSLRKPNLWGKNWEKR